MSDYQAPAFMAEVEVKITYQDGHTEKLSFTAETTETHLQPDGSTVEDRLREAEEEARTDMAGAWEDLSGGMRRRLTPDGRADQ